MRTTLLLVFIGFSTLTFAQNTLLQLSGTLIDKTTGEPVYGAAVRVRETNTAATTDFEGKFVLKTVNKFPFTLEISGSGYSKQEFLVENEHTPLHFRLEPQVIVADEV